jgi:hypothetical protein
LNKRADECSEAMHRNELMARSTRLAQSRQLADILLTQDACNANEARRKIKKLHRSGAFFDGRYWARTSDPQLAELVLNGLFAALLAAVGKHLGKRHSGEDGFRRLRSDHFGSMSH